MSKIEFLDPREAEKLKKKSGNSFVGHPVIKIKEDNDSLVGSFGLFFRTKYTSLIFLFLDQHIVNYKHLFLY